MALFSDIVLLITICDELFLSIQCDVVTDGSILEASRRANNDREQLFSRRDGGLNSGGQLGVLSQRRHTTAASQRLAKVENNRHGTRRQNQNCTSDRDIMNRFQGAYNHYQRPSEIGVNVSIELWVQDITSVSEITADFELDLYITELWIDRALDYTDLMPCKQNVSLTHTILQDLWTPNTCFLNSKAASIHDSPFRNVFIMVYPNGTVWLNYRLRVKGPCDMDLTRFPMDQQTCMLSVTSFTFNTDEVKMRWHQTNPILILKEIKLPDFTFTQYDVKHMEVPYPAGQWDELTVTFQFKRRIGWYFLQAYVPTYLTIFISWISFCLSANTLPARTMLGVNSLLALTFQFGNIMRTLPRVSYVTAIDIWMLGCMSFIFASMLELALVGVLSRQQKLFAGDQSKRKISNASRKCSIAVHLKKYNQNKISPEHTVPRTLKITEDAVVRQYVVAAGVANSTQQPPLSPVFQGEERAPEVHEENSGYNSSAVVFVDQTSIIAFPSAFALFNLFYWSYCLYG